MDKKNIINILDIHTHQPATASGGKAIINYRVPADSALYVPQGIEGGEVFYSVGIHPWDLTESNVERQLDLLRQLLAKEPFVALGEAGLDKLAEAPMDLQMETFEKQVELSEEYKLPLIIHCVKAVDELLAVKKEYRPVQPWIWHGFRGKPQQAEQLLQKEFYLSFGAHYPDETMRVVPADRLFLETDDSLVDIEELLRCAARVRGVEVEALRTAVHKNIQKVFFSA